MTRRIPFLPTLLVALAVATMVALGLWQLQRATWKEGLLSRYETARGLPVIEVPRVATPEFAFRRATAICGDAARSTPRAGRNLDDQPGYVHILDCRRPGEPDPSFAANVGWSRDQLATTPLSWTGRVTGPLIPTSGDLPLIIAEQPAPGLERAQAPGPETVPNNHRLYAVQWFFFALAAAVIYAVALRKRWREAPGP